MTIARYLRVLQAAAGMIVLAAAWQVLSLFFPPYLFPPVPEIIARTIEILITGSLMVDVLLTAARIFGGLFGAFILGGSPTVTTNRGVYVRNQGGASIATALGIDVEAITAGTNRYGLRIGDMPGSTIARILELGPTPYLRLLGSGNWTPTANQTPLYLAEGATPTLRQVQWKAGNALVAGDKVLVLV